MLSRTDFPLGEAMGTRHRISYQILSHGIWGHLRLGYKDTRRSHGPQLSRKSEGDMWWFMPTYQCQFLISQNLSHREASLSHFRVASCDCLNAKMSDLTTWCIITFHLNGEATRKGWYLRYVPVSSCVCVCRCYRESVQSQHNWRSQSLLLPWAFQGSNSGSRT